MFMPCIYHFGLVALTKHTATWTAQLVCLTKDLFIWLPANKSKWNEYISDICPTTCNIVTLPLLCLDAKFLHVKNTWVLICRVRVYICQGEWESDAKLGVFLFQSESTCFLGSKRAESETTIVFSLMFSKADICHHYHMHNVIYGLILNHRLMSSQQHWGRSPTRMDMFVLTE